MKTSEPLRTDHRISRIGPSAARTLDRPCQGQVAAVFDRSVYCLIDGNYICVGVDSLGMCPLNVVTSVPEGSAWLTFGFHTGMSVNVDREHMRIGGDFSLKLSEAQVWRPPPPADLCYETLENGLAALEKAVAGRIPTDGLGRLIHPVLRGDLLADNIMDHAAKPLGALTNWLKKALRDPLGNQDTEINGWQGLLGLGPGLTPSGDDLTGGMMLALHRLGQMSVLRTLSCSVTRVIDERTSPISAAHLKAAMDGMGSEAIHLIMDVIFDNDGRNIPSAIAEIEKVGHTSGWDTLAGVVIVIRLWLDVNKNRSRSRRNYMLQ